LKILNPYDNLDENKVESIEKVISDFYSFSSEVDFTANSKLVGFNDCDLESIIDEGNQVDIMKLLDIDDLSKTSKRENSQDIKQTEEITTDSKKKVAIDIEDEDEEN
jgi:hypothetical protein